MTQRELEKLLRRPEVLQELEQSLFGDPALWASQDDRNSAKGPEGISAQKNLQIRNEVTQRVMRPEPSESRAIAPRRRYGNRALQWTAAAACVALFVCYIAFYPQAKSLATSYEERVARKVEGHVIIESAEDANPDNGETSTGMRVSGVDGFEMYSYENIDEYMQKTGRDPVLVTGGYEKIVSIMDELDPDRGYTLMIAYELKSGEYISTSQFYAKEIEERIFADSYERTVLGDKTMFCRVEDDNSYTYGTVRLADDCTFSLFVPYAEQFDPYADGLAFASQVDAARFFVPPPEPMPESEEDGAYSPSETSYTTFEEFSRANGLWPIILDEPYAKPVSITFYSGLLTQTLSVEYEKAGQRIYAFEHFNAMGSEAYTMEDKTYYTTKVLGKYTMHCSVDLQDGSTAGVAVVNGSSFFIVAEKGIDYKELLKHLYIMEH